MRMFGYDITVRVQRAPFTYAGWTINRRGDHWTAVKDYTVMNRYDSVKRLKAAIDAENARAAARARQTEAGSGRAYYDYCRTNAPEPPPNDKVRKPC